METEIVYTPKHFSLPDDNTQPRTDKTEPYVFNNDIAIAIDIALATKRPLLVAGAPGSGKSRLAEAMATLLQWNYLSYTVTSRTRLEDLTADSDHLQRMHDAQTRTKDEGMKPDWAYFKPGIFWWAFNKESASCRSGTPAEAKKHQCTLDFPGSEAVNQEHANKTVLLIDEIDKAEPDLPNDLLEPLDRQQFSLPNGKKFAASSKLEILTIITTNRERDLPAAFMRRCISLVLQAPDSRKLQDIAYHHFKDTKTNLSNKRFNQLVPKIADKIIDLQTQAKTQNRRAPSTSEFLDAVKTCDQLKISIDDEIWILVEQSILNKDLSDKND